MKNQCETFGEVRWGNGDIELELAIQGIEPTEQNVSKVRDAINESELIEDMIQAGWGYIRDKIENIDF